MFIGCYIVSLFYFCGWLSLRNVLKYEMCEIDCEIECEIECEIDSEIDCNPNPRCSN